MKIIVLGVGNVGETLFENLLAEKHTVTVIDTDATTVNSFVNKYDINGVIGNGIERDTLLNAKVSDADFFIATVSKDEVNILSCVLAKKLGAKFTIARVRDPEYFKEIPALKAELNIDMTFNPEYRTAVEIFSNLKFPSATNVETFAKGHATMVDLPICEGNPIIGKSIIEIVREYGHSVLFAVVKRGEEYIVPHGEFVIQVDDTVSIIGGEDDIVLFTKQLKIYNHKSKSVFIIGGSRIAYYLGDVLIKNGISVKIIESDKERAKELSFKLPKATVFYGDGSDDSILEEEGIKNADAFVTLTNVDEENVIISLYAKKYKVPKIITKLDRPSVKNMVKEFGLDTIVSPRDVISNIVLRYVRAHQEESGKGINTLYKVSDKVEALEFTVREDFSGINTPINQLKFKKNILLGGIVRDGEYSLPTGQSLILPKDKIIVISSSRQISELEQILD